MSLVRQFPEVRIQGDGLVLRPLAEDDVDDVAVAGADPLTQRWLPLPYPYTVETAREFVGTFAPAQRESGVGVVLAVEVESRLAGAIDLKRTDWRAGTTEIGYWVAPWARGRGVAGRATRALAEWALRDQGLERVEVRAADGNRASQRAAEAAGFVREGVLRNAGFVHGGRVDLVVYGLVRADLGLAAHPGS